MTVPGHENGYYVGPVVFTDVKPGMEIHSTEIFGPVAVILNFFVDEKVVTERYWNEADA